MRELSFMGPSNDGKRLLLVADDGTQFELAVDSRLISVVSREHGPSAPPRSSASSPTMPTPREIQDQVRRGASIDQIAESAGVAAEDVAKFAYPVVTERAHVAAQARETLVKVDGEHVTLENAVLARIKIRAVDPRLIRWDAWRTEGSSWTVIAAYPANQGERVATFTYDARGKSVTANDDEARWLLEVGEATSAAAKTPATEPQRPRPQMVPNNPEEPKRADAAGSLSGSTEQTKSEPTAQPRMWDRAHPAARAHERREANGGPRTPDVEAKTPASARVSPDHPAATSQPERPKEETPQWEELLFGSPGHDDSN